MARLGFNMEHVAALRRTGNDQEPDPVSACVFAEIGGADGIVCPLTDELRPVTERDAKILRETVKTHLNLRISPTENMLSLALSIKPDMITVVSGKKPGSTPGGGLDVLGHEVALAKIIREVREQNIVVSLLVDPEIYQIKSAAKIGADFVELHMGLYVKAGNFNDRADQLEAIASNSAAAEKLGLGVSAGCGLNYQNVQDITGISQIEEINIGHAVAARALWVGLEAAVRDMVALVH